MSLLCLLQPDCQRPYLCPRRRNNDCRQLFIVCNLPLLLDIPPVAQTRILWDRIQNSTLGNQTWRVEANLHPSEATDGHRWQLSLDDRRLENAASSAMQIQVNAGVSYNISTVTFRRVHLLSAGGRTRSP